MKNGSIYRHKRTRALYYFEHMVLIKDVVTRKWVGGIQYSDPRTKCHYVRTQKDFVDRFQFEAIE